MRCRWDAARIRLLDRFRIAEDVGKLRRKQRNFRLRVPEPRHLGDAHDLPQRERRSDHFGMLAWSVESQELGADMRRMITVLVVLLMSAPLTLQGWGIDVHRYITRRAMDNLPPELHPFFAFNAISSSSMPLI